MMAIMNDKVANHIKCRKQSILFFNLAKNYGKQTHMSAINKQSEYEFVFLVILIKKFYCEADELLASFIMTILFLAIYISFGWT